MDTITMSEARAVVLNDAARLHTLLESVADDDLNVGCGITEQYAEELVGAIRATD